MKKSMTARQTQTSEKYCALKRMMHLKSINLIGEVKRKEGTAASFITDLKLQS